MIVYVLSGFVGIVVVCFLVMWWNNAHKTSALRCSCIWADDGTGENGRPAPYIVEHDKACPVHGCEG